ncbi:TPA: phage protein NinX family protein [Proteus mirabilis]
MNKYTELSDFEINLLVAQLIFSNNEYDVIKQSMEVVRFQNGGGKGICHEFDPCSNPSDAMPIVFESGISLISDWNEVGVWGATNQPWYSSENKNPLRAAMEVFLMIKDAENEKV